MKLGCIHPMGPLAPPTSSGFNDPKYRTVPLLKEMVDAGRLGRKSGRGFCTYETPAESPRKAFTWTSPFPRIGSGDTRRRGQ